MNILGVKNIQTFINSVYFTEDMLYIHLLDGRELGVPLEWFPKLRNATVQQLENWRLIGKGVGIHWEDIDEDISLAGLLKL
jgi:hypothetical protein